MLSAIPKDEIIIPNIYYPFDKAYLTPEAKTAIDPSIYELLIENPTLIVKIGSQALKELENTTKTCLKKSTVDCKLLG